jgi:hypothetical protein
MLARTFMLIVWLQELLEENTFDPSFHSLSPPETLVGVDARLTLIYDLRERNSCRLERTVSGKPMERVIEWPGTHWRKNRPG